MEEIIKFLILVVVIFAALQLITGLKHLEIDVTCVSDNMISSHPCRQWKISW